MKRLPLARWLLMGNSFMTFAMAMLMFMDTPWKGPHLKPIPLPAHLHSRRGLLRADARDWRWHEHGGVSRCTRRVFWTSSLG